MQRLSQKQQVIKIVTVTFSLLVLPLLLLTLAWLLPATAQQAKHYTDLTFPTLPAVKLPKYTRFQLANGMVVYLMEDHELPLVDGSAFIRTGDRWEPATQVGVASLAGTVMRTGGTDTRSADTINRFLEQQAASVETGIGETYGSAGFSALAEDLEPVFQVFADVLQHPTFPQNQLTIEKTKLRGAIARRNDDPGGITSREFQKLIYGQDNPYARTIEYTTLDNISREDLVRFYQQYYYPNNLILGIVGDFDSQKMRHLIEVAFQDWQPKPDLKVPPLPTVSPIAQGGVFLINQPQLTQSNIRMGHLGGQFDSPDFPALTVMNEVLNGFGGRLFNQVRSRQGLAYSVYGTWDARFDYPGMFVAGGQTRSEATVPFVQSLKVELEKIRTAPVTETELKEAKDSVINSFVFNFQAPGQTLSRLLRYEYFGYPSDFIFRFQKGIEATTVADVQRVAKTYLTPDKMVILVVGNQAQIIPTLSSLTPNGQVSAVDITIPPPAKKI
ncbi:MAG TPA: pitrilysin family protein [Coleofasciculaceae cyanobacterium]